MSADDPVRLLDHTSLEQLILSHEQLIVKAEAALAAEDTATALRLLDRAQQLGGEPDRCAGNRWLAHMLRGDLTSAWRESDAIRQRGAPDPHRYWNGEDLQGKRVILRSLHGFGDAVQMFRFLPRLEALASHLVVEVPPRLVELAPCFAGMREVITWGEGAPERPPAWEVQLEVMELPYLFRVGTDDLQPTDGYLRLPHETILATRDVMRMKRKPRVGVVWTAGDWNPSRSLPANLLPELQTVEGVEFWNLQGGSDRHTGPAGWRDVYECGDGILALAATVSEMDLVITVDTLAAHLAGALATPCWLLLQHRADWRWMSRREDTPWYPSLRLLRQDAEGGWEALILRVRRALGHWVAEQGC